METTNRMCRWARRRLPLLAGGDLGVEERRRVERHLIGCPGCRDRRDSAGQALAALQLAGADRPGREARAGQIRESRHQPAPAPRWGWRPAGLRLAAAAGLIGVGLGLGITWDGGAAARPDPAVAATPAPVAPRVPAPVEPVAPVLAPEAVYAINDSDLPGANNLLAREDAATARRPPRAAVEPAPQQPDPFRAPTSLRVDYDLEYVTAPAPLSPALRQAY